MAQASSSRPLPRTVLEESSSEDERKRSSTSNRRHNYYGDQRSSRSSRPATGGNNATSHSKHKQPSYEQPADFSNLDEQAVSPPIENPDDRRTYRRQSSLEDTLRGTRTVSQVQRERRASDRREPVRKRKSTHHGSQDLTEVAAPPPVQKSLDQETGIGQQQQRFLEDEEREEDVSDENSPPWQQPQPAEFAQKKDEAPEVPKYLTELYTISYLIFFAIMGTLARLGVQWITFYPGTPIVTPVIWANFGGSLIMGFLAEDQGLFRDNSATEDLQNGLATEKKRRRSHIQEDLDKMTKAEHSKRKKTIPLYIGLATGFCGSFTSFSSFARDFFLALSNDLPTPYNHPHPGIATLHTTSTVSRNGGYAFEAFIHVVLATLALSLGGLIVGAHVAIFLDPYSPRIHGSFVRVVLDRVMVVLGFGCWLGAIFLAIWPPHEAWRGEVVFALVFAPLGCLLRFYASLKLNGLVPAFPLGTFAVNMLGTAVEGTCFDIQHVGVGVMGRIGGGMTGCQILQGVMDGFCGCLTTVSTWVAEINGLKRKHGWGYALGSVLGGLCLMVVIMGSVRWSVGYSNPVCDTGYTSKIHG